MVYKHVQFYLSDIFKTTRFTFKLFISLLSFENMNTLFIIFISYLVETNV